MGAPPWHEMIFWLRYVSKCTPEVKSAALARARTDIVDRVGEGVVFNLGELGVFCIAS